MTEDIASSCRHEYAHYEDEMFRDSFDPEVLLRAADEIAYLRSQIDTLQNLWEKDRAILQKYYDEDDRDMAGGDIFTQKKGNI